MIVGPAMPTPRTLRIGGAFASAISSWRISSSMNVRPRPPYSFGHVSPMKPASKSLRCHVFKSSYASTRGISELPTCFHSRGMFALSQARRVWRKVSCSGDSEKSISPPGGGVLRSDEPWFILGILLGRSQDDILHLRDRDHARASARARRDARPLRRPAGRRRDAPVLVHTARGGARLAPRRAS